jgi:hypothetical protein
MFPLIPNLRRQTVHEVFLGFPGLVFEPKPLVHFPTNPEAFIDAPENKSDCGKVTKKLEHSHPPQRLARATYLLANHHQLPDTCSDRLRRAAGSKLKNAAPVWVLVRP